MNIKTKMPNVAGNIKKCREIRNYDQPYLALQLDISTTSYRNIESGHTKITLEYLFAIAQILNVSIGTLLYFDENMVLETYEQESSAKSKNSIQPSDNTIKDVVSMISYGHEKLLEIVEKNHQLTNEISEIIKHTTKLVREIVVLNNNK